MTMTWRELRDFCNSLDEKQLEKKVIIWQEESAITEIDAEILAEDHYIDEANDLEGCSPLSEIKLMIENNEDAYPNGMEDFKKVYEKGTPILWENF